MKKSKDSTKKKNPLDDPKRMVNITTGDGKVVKVPAILYKISTIIKEDTKKITISNADATAIHRVQEYYDTWSELTDAQQKQLIIFEYLQPPKKTRRKKAPKALDPATVTALTNIYNSYKDLPKADFFILLATAKSMQIDSLIRLLSHIIAADIKAIDTDDRPLKEVMQEHFE